MGGLGLSLRSPFRIYTHQFCMSQSTYDVISPFVGEITHYLYTITNPPTRGIIVAVFSYHLLNEKAPVFQSQGSENNGLR